MSSNDRNETESPDIIEEIIPGKNNDYNDKSINQNNNNNQQSFIENYNEQESAQSVIEAPGESKKTIDRNTNETGKEIPRYSQAITNAQEQTGLATRDITRNYLELQKQTIDSFQSVFMPYFQNVNNQVWNSQEFFKSISEMYSRLVSNYTESAIAFGKMWNDIAFTNMGLFKNATNKATE